MSEPTSWHDSWWEAFREDDAVARAAWDRHVHQPLVRFCGYYLGSRDEAEDAAQEVLCKLLEQAEKPREVRPWAYRVARNLCLNVRRARARRRDGQRLPTTFEVAADLTGPITRMVRGERAEEVQKRLAQLPDAQREPLVLRYVEGLDRAEIAEVLELSVSVVKSRLFEGLSRLRSEL
ncbi:MAG: RNA polymerase sigma factor [Planctomycetota bacterium]